jgi:hypothetical protein
MDIIGIFASLLRVVGFLFLGVGLTWITLYMLKQEGKPWYLQAVVFVAFFGLFAVLLWRINPAGAGALALGAGGGLLFWGPRAMKGGEALAVPQVTQINTPAPEPPAAPVKEEPVSPVEPIRTPRKVARKEE